MNFLAYFLAFAVLLNGCANDVITFKSDKRATVSVVDWDSLEEDGENLGQTPAEISYEQVKGKVVKIQAEGHVPQYWVVSEKLGDSLEAKLKLVPLQAGEGETKTTTAASSADANTTHRLLLQAYRALVKGDYTSARSISERISEMAPALAAPLIVSGLSYIEEGNKGAANKVFQQAQTLDPNDQQISDLIKATQ